MIFLSSKYLYVIFSSIFLPSKYLYVHFFVDFFAVKIFIRSFFHWFDLFCVFFYWKFFCVLFLIFFPYYSVYFFSASHVVHGAAMGTKTLPYCMLVLMLPFRILFYCAKAVLFCLIPDCLRKKKNLANEVIVITGGGSGIGRSLALQLAKTGARIVICDINGKNGEAVCREVREDGGNAWFYACDVSDRKQVYALAARVTEEVGSCSV